MGNYGMRISTDGKDVKTCDDHETVITSKYPILKGAIYGNGSITNNGNETTIATIPHGLGYIPMPQVFVRFGDEDFWSETPVLISFLSTKSVYAYADDTNLYIKTVQYAESSRTFYYQYFIYIDKGKLS